MGLEVRNEETEEEIAHREEEQPLPPFPLYTYILLGCIGVVFIGQFLTSTDPNFFAIDRVSGYYAGFDKQLFLAGEWWRPLTAILVHYGVLHVAMNSYALFSFGRLIEMLSNRAHVAIVFLLAALGGDFLSLVFNPEARSAGASGGIVGLLSYLAVYAFKRRQFISKEFRKSLLVNIGFILVFGFVLFDRIDNFGHIGGLVAGAIYGLVQIPSDEYTDPRTANPVTKIAGVASLAVVILTAVVTVMILYAASK